MTEETSVELNCRQSSDEDPDDSDDEHTEERQYFTAYSADSTATEASAHTNSKRKSDDRNEADQATEEKFDERSLRADTNGLFYNENGGRSTGPATTFQRQDKGLASSVGYANRDGKGRRLSSNQRKRANYLRRWQRRVQVSGSRERSVRTGLDEINRMGSALGVDDSTRQLAARLFRQAADSDLLIGRAIESVASGSLYAAARVAGYPRSFDEIAQVSRVERNRIITGYEVLRDEFELSLAPVDPAAYVDRFATACGASTEVTRTAREVIYTATEHEGGDKSIIGGTSPTSIAAAALFVASEIHETELTQCEIADAADVHVTTVRNNYPQLQAVYEPEEGE